MGMMKIIILVLLVATLSGCSLFDGYGSDGSKLVIDRTCEVSLKQDERVAGGDDADVLEKVNVSPDCTTEVLFRQTVGDDVKQIESREDEAAGG